MGGGGGGAATEVFTADLVAAQRMWPPLGSAWEPAVVAGGGVCYIHSGSGDTAWEPPAGSGLAPRGAAAVYPRPCQLVEAPGLYRRDRHSARAPPPEHARGSGCGDSGGRGGRGGRGGGSGGGGGGVGGVSMLASPCVAGEREPRWVGQYDAVAREHLFVHRLTHAVRRGPWVSMLRDDGRVYYLSLLTSAARWDPPPLWEVQWVERAPDGRPEAAVARHAPVARHLPAAVPRGREVCGGAAVGVDLVAVIQPDVEQLLERLRVDEGSAGALADAFGGAPPAGDDPERSRLAALCWLGTALLRAACERFALPGAAPRLSLTDLCPALRCAGPGGGIADMERSQVACCVGLLRERLGSASAVSRALLPAVTAAGGFCVYG